MRRSHVASFDLGDEPPLGVDGDAEEPINRRRISIRWLMATLLTGISGAALMGGAVYAALDNDYNVARTPETVRSALRGALAAGERPSNVARKGDRMSLLSESFSARQTLRLASVTEEGEREIIRVRAVTRVSTNLAQSVTSASVDVPRFNPAKLIAESSGAPDVDNAQAEPTDDLTIVLRDISGLPPSTRFAADLPMEDVLMKVRETAEFSLPAPDSRPPAVTGIGTMAFAPAGQADPANALQQPDNLSSMRKSGDEASGGNGWSERTLVAKGGETIVSLLKDLGVTQASASAAAAAFPARELQGALPASFRMKVLLDEGSETAQPLRISLFNDRGFQGSVALSDAGRYVPVRQLDDSHLADLGPETPGEDEAGSGRITLYESIWETALRYEVPRPVIENMIRVYSFDVDFERPVRAGDSFDVVFESDEAGGAGGVLFAGLTTGGEERRYYRYQTRDDGLIDFYDENGKSAKKFLVRKPLSGGTMRSGFGMRRHPILGYSRLHSGVDWSDRTGTPIYAAGNGVIKKAGWSSGYGRRIEIQHANGYVTTYSHQSSFAKGIRDGVRVRQGQLIGYVGSTGLSTGAHLHYEVLVNGRFVDPMRIRLPRGRALDGKMLAAFEAERERIDTLLNSNGPRIASSGSN